MKKSIIALLSFFISAVSFSQNEASELYWVGTDTSCGYVNTLGDTIIPIGKYQACSADTLSELGMVFTADFKWVGINSSDEFLFEVFIYENGPDYVEEGLFRIVENDKIGFANTGGEIVIKPQFDAAFPFKDGVSEVGKTCFIESEQEHWFWVCQEWFLLDKKGNLHPK